MKEPQTRPAPLPPRTLAWIGWGAMAFAVVMYAGVGLALHGTRAPRPAGLPFWLLPALAAAAAFAAVLLQLRRTLAGDAANEPAPTPTAGTRSAVGPAWRFVVWALDEAVAVIGLVALLTGAGTRVFGIYLGASLALLVLHRPRG